MIELKFKDKKCLIKNEASEITLKEYLQVLKIQQEKTEYDFDTFFKIFKILGATDEVLDFVGQQTLAECIKQFNMYKIETKFIKKIKIDGYTYSSEKFFDGKNFSMPAKKYTMIEKKIKDGDINWMLDLAAIIFERTDLTEIEHNDEAHIKQKKKLFESVTINHFVPYFAKFTEDTIESYQIIMGENVG